MSEVPEKLVLSASDAASVLGRLASLGEPAAQAVFYRITSLWLGPLRTHVTYRPSDDERAVLGKIALPRTVVQSHRYVARYRCDRKPVEVLIRTNTYPPKRRVLRVAGGDARFTLTEVTDLTTKEKQTIMAKKPKAPVADPEDELAAELEGLEELEEIEGVEPDEADEEESDEVSDEEEDDDEAVDLDAMTVAQLKAFAKENGVKGIDKKAKPALIALIKETLGGSDDEEDDEEDDETEDGPDFASMDRSALKAYITEQDESFKAKKSQSDDDLRELAASFTSTDEEEPEDEEEDEEEDDDAVDLDTLDRSALKAVIKEQELAVRVTKGMSDDDIRSAIRGALGIDGADEDEEEEDEPVEPSKKAASGAKGKGRTPPTPPNRELPKGKLGAEAVAAAAGTDARSVRMFLRSERGKAWPKDEELNRYAFTAKQVEAIAKAMKDKPARKLAGAAKAAADRKIAGTKPTGKVAGKGKPKIK